MFHPNSYADSHALNIMKKNCNSIYTRGLSIKYAASIIFQPWSSNDATISIMGNKQHRLLNVSLLVDLNSDAVSHCPYSLFFSLCIWQMNPVWRWTVFVTSHRHWPVTLSLYRLSSEQRHILQTCSNQTHETPSTRVSIPNGVYADSQILFTILSCESFIHLIELRL